jgi:hypothetical protein
VSGRREGHVRDGKYGQVTRPELDLEELQRFTVSPVSRFPRAMTGEELAVLEFLLEPDFPGAETLRDQARHAEVTDLCGCGCPSFSLAVDKSRSTRAEVSPGHPVILAAASLDLDPPYELLLFTDDGWLSYVELVWYGESPPPSFPALSDFEPAEWHQ